MIYLENISKVYTSKYNEKVALKNITLFFPKNGFVCIKGKSGSGKTTLLNILGLIEKSTVGDIFLKGNDVSNFSEKKRLQYLNKESSFIFKENNLFEEFTVKQNIVFGLNFHNNVDEKVREVLKLVNLRNYENRKVSNLSGGQKQRVSIARAIARNSKIILADEPTSSLDIENSNEIYKILKEISKEKLVVVVSHDKNNIIDNYADFFTELKNGQIISSNLPQKTNFYFDNIDKNDLKVKNNNSFLSLIFHFIYKQKSKFFISLFLFLITSLLLSFVFSIYTINPRKNISSKLKSIGDETLFLSKKVEINGDKNDYFMKMNNLEAEKFLKKFTNSVLMYQVLENFYNFSEERKNEWFSGTSEITNNILLKFNINLIEGRLPIKNENDNEIVISKIYAEQLIKNNFFDQYIDNIKDVINQKVKLNFSEYSIKKEYIIVGIINTKFAFDDENFSQRIKMDNFRNKFNNKLHSLIYFREKFHQENFPTKLGKNLFLESEISRHSSITSNFKEFKIIFFNKIKRNFLNKDEAVLPVFLNEHDRDLLKNNIKKSIENYVNESYVKIKEKLKIKLGKETNKEDYIFYIYNNEVNEFDVNNSYKDFYEKESICIANSLSINERVETFKYSVEGEKYKLNVKIIGFYFSNDFLLNDILLLSENNYNILVKNNSYSENIVKGLIVSTSNDANENLKLLNYSEKIKNNKDDSFQYDYAKYKLTGISTIQIDIFNNKILELRNILTYICTILVIIVIIILSYFAYDSFKLQRKKLGILLSLGYSKNKISLIGLGEIMLISLIIFPLTILVSLLVFFFLNNFFVNNYNLSFRFFKINYLPLFLLTIITFISVSSFLFLYITFKKRSIIELIRGE